MESLTTRPLLALVAGDPAGVGPEVLLKSWADDAARNAADWIVVGSSAVFDYYIQLYNLPITTRRVSSPRRSGAVRGVLDVLETGECPKNLKPGVVQAEAGALAHAALLEAARLCQTGFIDGMVTGPTSKTSLRAAGVHVEGQTELLGEYWGGGPYGMLVVAGAMRVLLLTRHMPLREALSKINVDSVYDHLILLNKTLQRMGIATPRLALAGFNPHAGEGRMFGDEDADLLEPAVARARGAGIAVDGPLPADSLFGRAHRGEFDGVVSLFHDQGLIAAKTVAYDRAITIIAGAPHLRVSVIHGAGFDRAGRGIADATNMKCAMIEGARLAPLWRASNINNPTVL